MTKIGIAADLHTGRGGERRLPRFKKLFTEMIDGMIDHAIEVAMFAGDDFDKWYAFNPATFELIDAEMKRLEAKGIEIVKIAGNHDYDTAGVTTAIKAFDRIGLHVLEKPTWAFLKHPVFLIAIPWLTKARVKADPQMAGVPSAKVVEMIHEKILRPFIEEMIPKVEEYKKAGRTTICLFHASLIGFDFGTQTCIIGTDFVIDPSLLLSLGCDHVVGGHFHKRQEKDGILYVGSPERNTFGERDNPTGWLFIEGNERKFVELRSSTKYRHIETDFTTIGVDEWIKGIKQDDVSGHNVKLRFKISRLQPVDRVSLEAALLKSGAESVILDPNYTDEMQVRSREIKTEMSIEEQFKIWLKLNPTKDPDGGLLRVLKAETAEGFPEIVNGADGKCNLEHLNKMIMAMVGG